MNKPLRQHPVGMLRYTWRFLFLLLVPLIRGMRHIRSPQGIYHWLRGGWIDLLAIGALLALSGLAWWRHTYILTPDRLTLQRGILLRRFTVIPLHRITTLTVERRLWLRPLGAVGITVDTEAGNHRLADVHLTVTRRQAALFTPDTVPAMLRPSTGRLWLLSVLASDSLSGILLLAALFYRIGVLLGEEVHRLVWDNLQAVTEGNAIPRTASLLGLILLGGWLITACRHLLQHLPFYVYRLEDTLVIITGFLSRRIHSCAVKAIHYTDIKQTLLSCLTGKRTIYISCTGYGKDKNTLAVLIPPASRAQASRELVALLPSPYRPVPVSVQPTLSAWWRYTYLPLLGLLSVLLLSDRLAEWLPTWSERLSPLMGLAALPWLWLLVIRWLAHRRAGIGYAKGRFTLCYFRRLTLHRVTVPIDHIALVRVRRSPFQRWRGRCDVLVYSYHEFRRPHRIRHLPLTAVERLHKLFRKEE